MLVTNGKSCMCFSRYRHIFYVDNMVLCMLIYSERSCVNYQNMIV